MMLLRKIFKSSTLPRLHYAPRVYSSSKAAMCEIIEAELTAIREAGTWKGERIITSKQSSSIGVTTCKNTVLNFCANNYLGLSVSRLLYNIPYMCYFDFRTFYVKKIVMKILAILVTCKKRQTLFKDDFVTNN